MRFSIIFALLLLSLSYPRLSWAVSTDYNSTLRCASAGHMICQLELGKAYAFGSEEWGLSPDYEKALYWLKQKPSQDFGYGANADALETVTAIEDYQNTGRKTLLQRLQSTGSILPPDIGDDFEAVILAKESEQERATRIAAASKEEYREWKLNFIRFTIIGAVLLVSCCIASWMAYCYRQQLRSIACEFERRCRMVERITRFVSSKKVRLPSAVYLIWVLLLLFTNSLQFEDIFDRSHHDIEQFQMLATLPPLFLAIAYAVIRWGVRSHPKDGVKHD